MKSEVKKKMMAKLRKSLYLSHDEGTTEEKVN